MRFTRGILLISFVAVFAAGALAQDSLLGKKKGSGGSGGSSNPPAQSGSQGSKKDRGSDRNSGSSNNSEDTQRDQQQSGLKQKTGYASPDINRKRFQSRSGKVNYGTSNNLLNKQNPNRDPIQIDRAPSRRALDEGSASMRDQMRREDRSQVRDRDRDRDRDGRWHDRDDNNWGRGGFRVGYYQYDSRFRDDLFCYPYYVFNPYIVETCIVSPWYYYSYLPAYVSSSRIVVTPDYGHVFVGYPYDYLPPNTRRRYNDDRDGRYDYNQHALDYAIDDIVDAFMRQDRRLIDRLVPRNGAVTLGVDGSISYGVRTDDFYDMFTDVVMNSRTINYEIVDVKTSDDEAEVTARHDYLDSWGQRQVVFHKYHLRSERGNVVIRFFETTNNAYW